MSRTRLLRQLAKLSSSMAQGGLSSTTRTCGKPACLCHSDPARRHGPNLYFTWRSVGKSHSLYVPADRADQAKAAQAAWSRFWEIGCQIAALNREQLRKQWTQSKPKATRRATS
jgi:hypothetical protein